VTSSWTSIEGVCLRRHMSQGTRHNRGEKSFRGQLLDCDTLRDTVCEQCVNLV